MVILRGTGFLVGQVGEALHGLLPAQFSIARALPHCSDGFPGHGRAPVMAIYRVRHAFIAACMTVFMVHRRPPRHRGDPGAPAQHSILSLPGAVLI